MTIIFLYSVVDMIINRHVEGRWVYNIMILACYCFCMYFITSIRQHILKWPSMSKWDIPTDVIMFIGAISVFGTTYGLFCQIFMAEPQRCFDKGCTDVA